MSNDEITRLRTALDAATSYIFALEGQKETVVARARRSYEAALAALDQLDVSPTMGRNTEGADVWHLINQLADEEEGIDANVIRGWLDTTVRSALMSRKEKRAEALTPDGRAAPSPADGSELARAQGSTGSVDPTSPTYDPDQYGTPGPELGDDEVIVIKGVPYRVKTLRRLTQDGAVPVVTLHAVGAPDADTDPWDVPMNEIIPEDEVERFRPEADR